MVWVFFPFYLFFQNGGAAPASKSRIPPLASQPLGFGQRHDATVDIPLDTTNVMSSLIQGLPLKTVRFVLEWLILFSMIFI